MKLQNSNFFTALYSLYRLQEACVGHLDQISAHGRSSFIVAFHGIAQLRFNSFSFQQWRCHKFCLVCVEGKNSLYQSLCGSFCLLHPAFHCALLRWIWLRYLHPDRRSLKKTVRSPPQLLFFFQAKHSFFNFCFCFLCCGTLEHSLDPP